MADILELNIESVELLLLLLFYFQNLATIKPEKPSFFTILKNFSQRMRICQKQKTLPLCPHWAITCTFVSSPSHFHRIQWSKEPNKPEGLFFNLPVKHLT